MSMNGNFARSILCSLVTSVDFGWYSPIVGVCCFCGVWSCCVIAARGQTISAANTATRMIATKFIVRREFIVPFGFFEPPAYLPTGRCVSAAESSVRINSDAPAQAAPFRSVRSAWLDCRVSRAGHRRSHRAASSRAADRSFLAWPETRRIRNPGNRQILRMDFWLVSADRHHRERRILFRDFRVCYAHCGPPPFLSTSLGGGWNWSERRNKRLDNDIGQAGSTTLTRVPPPVSQTTGTNSGTAQCR